MKILWLLLILTFVSCKTEVEPMDEWEVKISEYLQANRIELSHKNISHTINGIPDGVENFIELNIYESKVMEDIRHNERLFEKKCNEIKDSILANPDLSSLPTFNEVRVQLIEDNGFLMFKSEKTQTVTFRIN